MNTKQKIVKAAVQLFNDNGLANVRLQMIADEIGISVGNLAYHFRNKEAILDAVDEQIATELSEILSTYRVFPMLIDLDNQLSKYFEFLTRYPFYFIDLLEFERAYPKLHSRRQELIGKMISQLRKRFDYNIKRGVIKAEPRAGIYDNVAQSMWGLISFWMPHRLAIGEEPVCEGKFKQMLWTQLFPYLTEKGLAEFDQIIVPLLRHHSE